MQLAMETGKGTVDNLYFLAGERLSFLCIEEIGRCASIVGIAKEAERYETFQKKKYS